MRGQVPGKLLLGHALAVGGYGAAPQTDRRVTRMAPSSGRRMDGSGQSEASPATTYSVFTADGSMAKGTAVALGHEGAATYPDVVVKPFLGG